MTDEMNTNMPPNSTAKMIAGVAICALTAALPARAADFMFYATPQNSSEIKGSFATDSFTAKIHVVESNHQLMLSKITAGASGGTYETKSYPIEFSFQGDGWSAELAMPIHMDVKTSFPEYDNHETTIKADVNVKITEEGETQMHKGIATLRLVDGEGYSSGEQSLSLEIVDADNPDILLYNSDSDITMETRANDMKREPHKICLASGNFEIKSDATQNDNLVAYNVPVYDNLVYYGIQTAAWTPIFNNAIGTNFGETISAPITSISIDMPIEPPYLPPAVNDPVPYDYSKKHTGRAPITQISIQMPADEPLIPREQPLIPTEQPLIPSL